MKVYKVELLIVDHDDVGDEIPDILEQHHQYPNSCIMPTVMNIESRDIGEWDDNHPLNDSSQQKFAYNILFNES